MRIVHQTSRPGKNFVAFFTHLGTRVGDFLWPRFCSGCQAVLAHKNQSCFCEDCSLTLLPLDERSACSVCAAPVYEKTFLENNAPHCFDCRRLCPMFQKITVAFQYGGALTNAIHQLKWQGRDDLATPLGRYLAPFLTTCAKRCDLLLPVPIHWRRLMQRGYNQAALLAQEAHRISQSTILLRQEILMRRHFSSPMAYKSPTERMLQVENAFFISHRNMKKIRGRRILLLDDVVTTGATVQACTSVLLSAGAQSVEVLALARAI